MLDAFFPKVFAIIPIVKIELDSVLVEAVVLGVQFDQKLFPFEA